MNWTWALIISATVIVGCAIAVDREIKASHKILTALYRWEGATSAQLRQLTGKPWMFGQALDYLRDRGLVIASAQDELGDIFSLTPEGKDEAVLLMAAELGA